MPTARQGNYTYTSHDHHSTFSAHQAGLLEAFRCLHLTQPIEAMRLCKTVGEAEGRA